MKGFLVEFWVAVYAEYSRYNVFGDEDIKLAYEIFYGDGMLHFSVKRLPGVLNNYGQNLERLPGNLRVELEINSSTILLSCRPVDGGEVRNP